MCMWLLNLFLNFCCLYQLLLKFCLIVCHMSSPPSPSYVVLQIILIPEVAIIVTLELFIILHLGSFNLSLCVFIILIDFCRVSIKSWCLLYYVNTFVGGVMVVALRC